MKCDGAKLKKFGPCLSNILSLLPGKKNCGCPEDKSLWPKPPSYVCGENGKTYKCMEQMKCEGVKLEKVGRCHVMWGAAKDY